MEKEKVTCIVLSYNNIEFIYEAINSVLLQDYMNIELIISDDGSENFDVGEIKNYVEKNKGENIEKLIVNKNVVNIGTVKILTMLLRNLQENIFFLWQPMISLFQKVFSFC
ncbi:glycosyltransferase [Eubacterium limosum]|uniref:glycosyltransferase n=1 Tax=Eubacterium limosum TaxID=1736 RepID=UPI001062D709|nr:glycosyltransferase [Eubacterium limosum]